MMAQDSQRIWQGFLLVLFCVVAGVVLTNECGCASTPSPEDAAHTAKHGLTLERCKAEARAVGKDGGLVVWDACLADAGIVK